MRIVIDISITINNGDTISHTIISPFSFITCTALPVKATYWTCIRGNKINNAI